MTKKSESEVAPRPWPGLLLEDPSNALFRLLQYGWMVLLRQGKSRDGFGDTSVRLLAQSGKQRLDQVILKGQASCAVAKVAAELDGLQEQPADPVALLRLCSVQAEQATAQIAVRPAILPSGPLQEWLEDRQHFIDKTGWDALRQGRKRADRL